MRAATSFVAFLLVSLCLFGVAVQIVDKGGGASGAHARSQVTVRQRVVIGTFFGITGVLCIAAAVAACRTQDKAPDNKPPVDWDA
jgi:hypothetical protein